MGEMWCSTPPSPFPAYTHPLLPSPNINRTPRTTNVYNPFPNIHRNTPISHRNGLGPTRTPYQYLTPHSLARGQIVAAQRLMRISSRSENIRTRTFPITEYPPHDIPPHRSFPTEPLPSPTFPITEYPTSNILPSPLLPPDEATESDRAGRGGPYRETPVFAL